VLFPPLRLAPLFSRFARVLSAVRLRGGSLAMERQASDPLNATHGAVPTATLHGHGHVRAAFEGAGGPQRGSTGTPLNRSVDTGERVTHFVIVGISGPFSHCVCVWEHLWPISPLCVGISVPLRILCV
jgi:hypothetical protein